MEALLKSPKSVSVPLSPEVARQLPTDPRKREQVLELGVREWRVRKALLIDLLPGAIEEAKKTLSAQPQARERFERVAALIDGFESPYGLELLASTHWVATKDPEPARDAAAASEAIRSWTARKRSLFGPDHVAVAWGRLVDHAWLGT